MFIKQKEENGVVHHYLEVASCSAACRHPLDALPGGYLRGICVLLGSQAFLSSFSWRANEDSGLQGACTPLGIWVSTLFNFVLASIHPSFLPPSLFSYLPAHVTPIHPSYLSIYLSLYLFPYVGRGEVSICGINENIDSEVK